MLHSSNGEFPPDVVSRIALLGFRPAVISKAVRAGVDLRGQANRFEPSTAPGVRDWIGRVGELRYLLKMEAGWKPINPSNAPFSLNPEGTIALGVMLGDEGTGFLDRDLRSFYPKGNSIANLTLRNDLVGSFVPSIPGLDEQLPLRPSALAGAKVWFLVTRYVNEDGVVRVYREVSEPEPTEGGRRITRWADRIVLPPQEFGPTTSIGDEDGPEDVEVSVEAR
jgi:hypothetical protein